MRNRSGMALVLALLAVSFLVALTVQLFSTVNWQVKASTNLLDSVSLDAMNRSALNIARAALLADQKSNDYDSPADGWNHLNDRELNVLLGADSLTVEVADLSGKLQVNALISHEKDAKKRRNQENSQYALWLRFLTSGRFAVADEQEAVSLLDALLDWLDSDSDERDHGAEEGYYLSLDHPYKPRNAPMQSLEELLLIRGMTKDIFYGNEEFSGIVEYLTVYGTDGKININSAPAPVLQILAAGLDEEIVQGLIDFRQDEQNSDSLSDPQWYRQVRNFPGDIELNPDVITVQSSYFVVDSVVKMNEFTRTGSAVIHRDENGTQKLLRWEVD